MSPPVNSGGVHVNAKIDFYLYIVSSTKLVGGSGEVVIIAPFPSKDESESP